jgi:hypothetical protein
MDARARSPAADFENHIIVGDNGRRKGNIERQQKKKVVWYMETATNSHKKNVENECNTIDDQTKVKSTEK